MQAASHRAVLLRAARAEADGVVYRHVNRTPLLVRQSDKDRKATERKRYRIGQADPNDPRSFVLQYDNRVMPAFQGLTKAQARYYKRAALEQNITG